MEKDYTKLNLEPGAKESGSNGQTNSIPSKTVFSELKLSEILLGDVDRYK